METKTAEQRAQELMSMSGKNVPELAREYGKALCRSHGACMEVIFSAFAFYAQLEEGLSCEDPLYQAGEEEQKLFETIKAAI